MAAHAEVSRRSFIRRATGLAVAGVGFPYIVRPAALGRAGSVVNKHYGNDDANRRLVRAMRRPWRL